jgi:hypothetical protein
MYPYVSSFVRVYPIVLGPTRPFLFPFPLPGAIAGCGYCDIVGVHIASLGHCKYSPSLHNKATNNEPIEIKTGAHMRREGDRIQVRALRCIHAYAYGYMCMHQSPRRYIRSHQCCVHPMVTDVCSVYMCMYMGLM